jgi:antitoxin PrlF
MNEHVPGTKIAERLFARPQGATMAEVVAATGGRQHNLLERLKAKGYTIRSRKEGRTTRYWAESPTGSEVELTVSSKGQVTLPKEFRDRLGVRNGRKLRATIEDDRIVLARKSGGVDDLFGILHRPGMRPRSLKEIEEGIIAGATDRTLRVLRPPKR